MMVLETMDYLMIDIVKNVPHVPTNQPMKDNVKECDLGEKHSQEFDDEEKRLVAHDVRDHVAIQKSLPYDIYHFIQDDGYADCFLRRHG